MEEAAARAHDEPIEPTRALKFALAYLANRSRDRWPFDELYRELTTKTLENTEAQRFGRWQGINSALNGIYLQLGVERDHSLAGRL